MSTTPLRQIRIIQQKTLADVALAVGTTKGHLSIVETSGSGASPELAERLVQYFGADAISELEILYPERMRDSGSSLRTEMKLLTCFRRMRDGQKGVMLDLALMMTQPDPASWDRRGSGRSKDEEQGT